jgi:hypothetical protein
LAVNRAYVDYLRLVSEFCSWHLLNTMRAHSANERIVSKIRQ